MVDRCARMDVTSLYAEVVEWMGWQDTHDLRSKYLHDAAFHHLMDAVGLKLRRDDEIVSTRDGKTRTEMEDGRGSLGY